MKDSSHTLGSFRVRYSNHMGKNMTNTRLVQTTISDRNGVLRKVWKRPDELTPTQRAALPSPVPGSKAQATPRQTTIASPIDHLVSAIGNIFSKKESKEDLQDYLQSKHPTFTDRNTWMRDQSKKTLKIVKDILDVPNLADNEGLGRGNALRHNCSPEALKIIHANREFLSDGSTNVEFILELAKYLGPDNIAPDGRISNIEEHCEVAREFSIAASMRTNKSGLRRYVDAEGLCLALNEHPELLEPLKKYAVDAISVGHIFHMSNPNKSQEVIEIARTLSAYPEQAERINDFVVARGSSFSQEAYEGFEELPDMLDEGFL